MLGSPVKSSLFSQHGVTLPPAPERPYFLSSAEDEKIEAFTQTRIPNAMSRRNIPERKKPEEEVPEYSSIAIDKDKSHIVTTTLPPGIEANIVHRIPTLRKTKRAAARPRLRHPKRCLPLVSPSIIGNNVLCYLRGLIPSDFRPYLWMVKEMITGKLVDENDEKKVSVEIIYDVNDGSMSELQVPGYLQDAKPKYISVKHQISRASLKSFTSNEASHTNHITSLTNSTHDDNDIQTKFSDTLKEGAEVSVHLVKPVIFPICATEATKKNLFCKRSDYTHYMQSMRNKQQPELIPRRELVARTHP